MIAVAGVVMTEMVTVVVTVVVPVVAVGGIHVGVGSQMVVVLKMMTTSTLCDCRGHLPQEMSCQQSN